MNLFSEFRQLEQIVNELSRYARIETPATLTHHGQKYPLYSIVLGNPSPQAPVFGLIGGVHGIERIGTQVVLSYLQHLLERLSWDDGLRWQLERIRIILMPIVNPVGMKSFTRSNGNGVDLNRNSPIVAENATPLVGGHRISKLIPWHRGSSDQMEVESQALCDFVRRETFQSAHSIMVDVHSGFGVVDQLWFPYAKSKEPFPNLAEVGGLKVLLDRVLPHHVYKFEPQAIHYTTHGDLWDYLYEEFRREHGEAADSGERVFIPLTLELGSWNWVKKNPFQLLSFSGHYNPMKPHRMKRALRRHIPLFDFLIRSAISPSRWKVGATSQRDIFLEQAMLFWYRTGLKRLLPAPVITDGTDGG